MTAKSIILTAALIAAFALPLHGYNDVVTHPQLTIIAVEKSVLYTDGAIMRSLGLYPAETQLFIYRARGDDQLYGSADYSLSSFIAEGAFDEDMGNTARFHFFDPRFNRGLASTFVSSWEWILEEGTQTFFFQNRSLSDAKNYLRRGLTFNEGAPAAADEQRRIAMAEMFLSLGHVAHHIQDMAQPQHVRNDIHLDRWPIFVGIYDPSRYEEYTKDRGPFIQTLAEMAGPVFPGNASFKVPRNFWTNDSNSGIAQFTNQNYVSKRTNFTINGSVVNVGTYELPVPGTATPYTVQQLFDDSAVPVSAEVAALCGTPAINCTMMMYSTLAGPKATTLSIYDQDLRLNGKKLTYLPTDIIFPSYVTERLFALNRFNFDHAHQQLIGRAVSYSAGIINHFFRGKLEVMGPEVGPYSVVDHSSSQGFTKIRARVRNIGQEALSSGTLRAIAKFNRNFCYQSDLSGEFQLDAAGNLVPPAGCNNWRSEESHIRMTAEEPASFAVGETKPMTFTFSEAIPFNATDLILQVYYRGTVGDESNSFAIGAADLSEPTYFTVMNATDVFETAGAFHYYTDILANPSAYPSLDLNGDGILDVPVVGGNMNFEVFLNSQKVADIGTLPEGRFSRIAALVSPFGFQATLIARGNGFNSIASYPMPSKIFQYDAAANTLFISGVAKLRNHTLQWDSVSHYHYYPSTGTPLRSMPLSRANDATVAVTVQMTPETQMQTMVFEHEMRTSTESEDGPRKNKSEAVMGTTPIPYR